MGSTYSTYDAKARFSEILRKVRAGQHVTIAYRGRAVAEIRPVYGAGRDDQVLAELEDRGIVGTHRQPSGDLAPLAKRPGALARFLESRE